MPVLQWCAFPSPVVAGRRGRRSSDSSSLRFLTAAALAARRKEEEAAKSEATHEETQQQAAEALERARLLLETRKKRRKQKLPKASSSRSSRLDRQRVPAHASVFPVSLVATPVSVCVIAEHWNDYKSGSSPVKSVTELTLYFRVAPSTTNQRWRVRCFTLDSTSGVLCRPAGP